MNGGNDQKTVAVRLPIAVAKRLRQQAFDLEVSQGLIVVAALKALWASPAEFDLIDGVRERT